MSIVVECLPVAYKNPPEAVLEVSSSMARYWLANHKYPRQRAERLFHVRDLSQEMQAGRFRQKTQISFCHHDGRYYLTNGQHTLKAIVESGLSQVLSVIVQECASMMEVDDDFCRQDSNLTRRLGDSLVAHRLDEYFGVSKSQLTRMTSACFFYEYLSGGQSYRRVKTHDMKLSLVLRYGAHARDGLSLIADPDRKPYLTRRSTLACIMHTVKEQPQMATEFWTTLSEDDGLRSGSPQKTLLEYLKLHCVSNGGRYHSRHTVMAEQIIVKAIAKAWNYHFDGKRLDFIRVPKATTVVEFKDAGYVNLS